MKRVLILGLVLAAGCSRGAGLPVEDGKKWTYVTAEGEEFTIEIAGHESVRDKRCIVMVLKSEGAPVITRYLQTDMSGVKEIRLRLGEVDMFYQEPMWHLKGPAEVGSQYGDRIQMGPPFGGQIEYMGTYEVEEEITVPAGTFKCWRIQFSMDMGNLLHLRETRWLCPGKGLIRFHHESGIQGQVHRFQGDLISMN